jgi:hypothetical protein
MKYLLFANCDFYPREVLQDLVFRAESVEECKAWAESGAIDTYVDPGDTWTNYDSQDLTFTIVDYLTLKPLLKADRRFRQKGWAGPKEEALPLEWETLEK